MTIKELLSPIAAATIINLFLFALVWRGSKAEQRNGKAPWYFGPILLGYCGLAGLFTYLHADKGAAGALDIFAAAIVGQALGALVVFAILYALIFSRGQSRRDRAFAIAAALFLSGMTFAGIFAY